MLSPPTGGDSRRTRTRARFHYRRSPRLSRRVVGLSMHESDDVALEMKNTGAFEYLLKSSPASHLLETIRKAAIDARRASS